MKIVIEFEPGTEVIQAIPTSQDVRLSENETVSPTVGLDAGSFAGVGKPTPGRVAPGLPTDNRAIAASPPPHHLDTFPPTPHSDAAVDAGMPTV